MGNANSFLKLVMRSGSDKKFDLSKWESLNDVMVTTVEGEVTTIRNLVQNKCLYLVINTASK